MEEIATPHPHDRHGIVGLSQLYFLSGLHTATATIEGDEEMSRTAFHTKPQNDVVGQHYRAHCQTMGGDRYEAERGTVGRKDGASRTKGITSGARRGADNKSIGHIGGEQAAINTGLNFDKRGVVVLQHRHFVQRIGIKPGGFSRSLEGDEAALSHLVVAGYNLTYGSLDVIGGNIGKKPQTAGIDAQYRKGRTSQLFNSPQKGSIASKADDHCGTLGELTENTHLLLQFGGKNGIRQQPMVKFFLKLHIDSTRQKFANQPHGTGSCRGRTFVVTIDRHT